MQGVMWADVWSNKGWYQHLEFKGQQGFRYESRRSMATSDLLPETPEGCSAVFLPNSPWPPLSSICTSLLHPFISTLQQRSANKLLFFPSSLYSLSVAVVHSWSEQSHRFIGRTWPYCVRMQGWERKKRGRDTERPRVVQRSTWRTEDAGKWLNIRPTLVHSVNYITFRPFRQLIQ